MLSNSSGISAVANSTDRRRLILLALCLGVLVAQVDTSVVNLAAQPIGAAFHASVAALQWVLDAYNLAYAVLLLSGGLCADVFGRRRIFQFGAAVIMVLSFTHLGQPLLWAGVGLALTGVGMGINAGPLMSVAVDAVDRSARAPRRL